MRNHSHTNGANGDSFRRLEVITGVGRRRRWSDEDKARIVAESLDPGDDRFGGGLVLRVAREPAVHLAAAVRGTGARGCRVRAGAAGGGQRCPVTAAGRMEIALGPVVVRVGADVDATAPRRVLKVVRGLT